MISKILITYLQSQGFGTPGVDLFDGMIQDDRGNTITVLNEAGIVPRGGQDYDINVLGTQVVTTGTYDFASTTIMNLHRDIAGWYQMSATGISIISTHIQTPPARIGYNDFNNMQFTAHYLHYCEIRNNAYRTQK